ncbi:MAG: hypothetical protein HYY16_00480 [Planctomycetes bacterium]|nr:hypothetical protein [Planctomycetota bacterium]
MQSPDEDILEKNVERLVRECASPVSKERVDASCGAFLEKLDPSRSHRRQHLGGIITMAASLVICGTVLWAILSVQDGDNHAPSDGTKPQEFASVEQLVEQLAKDSIQERTAAASRLVALGESARPALESAVKGENAGLASRASAILRLLDALGPGEDERTSKARALFEKFPPEAGWGEDKRRELQEKSLRKEAVTAGEQEFLAGFQEWLWYKENVVGASGKGIEPYCEFRINGVEGVLKRSIRETVKETLSTDVALVINPSLPNAKGTMELLRQRESKLRHVMTLRIARSMSDELQRMPEDFRRDLNKVLESVTGSVHTISEVLFRNVRMR